MPIETAPYKYVLIVNAIQQRIEDGSYPPGSQIPSEAELSAEFDISRAVVVRALGILQQDGWIDSHQGKGRFVLARARTAARQAPAHLTGLLDLDETADVQLLSAGPVLAPNRAAAALGIDSGTPVIARRRLVVAQAGPVELGAVYVPVELAAGTALGKPEPIRDGVLRHLAQRTSVVFDHASQRISARQPTAEEAALLQVTRRECLLAVLVTVHDRTGTPQLAADALYPASRHELEDVFPVT